LSILSFRCWNKTKIVELDVDESAQGIAVEPSKDPHALYVSKMETERVREALLQLSEEFREIIPLQEFAELSYQEIASLLSCPLWTVLSRLATARSKLGTLLSSTQTRVLRPSCGAASTRACS
jgi:RNA polymerase sigma-70 factor, ECF subfamily